MSLPRPETGAARTEPETAPFCFVRSKSYYAAVLQPAPRLAILTDMSLAQLRRGMGGVVLAALLTACRQARPPLTSVFPLQNDVTVYVAVSSIAAKEDRGNVAAMVEVIEAELQDAGRRVAIVPARLDESPPSPRVEIQVRGADSGDATMRGAGQLTHMLSPVTGVALIGAGTGSMSADVYIVSSANSSTSLGHFVSSSFASFSDESIAAGERVGHAIATRLRLAYK